MAKTSLVAASLLIAALSLAACNRSTTPIGSETDTLREQGRAMVREIEPANLTDRISQCRDLMTQQLGAADADYDRRFIILMTKHHEDAIRMAEDAERKATHDELKKMATTTKNEHQQELVNLQKMSQQWYGKNLTEADLTTPQTGANPPASEPYATPPVRQE